LCHWYGLREFIILAPKRNNDAITDEDRANLLLSSTAIAVSNVGWYLLANGIELLTIFVFIFSNVPIFIRVQQEWRNMFIGICEGSGLRTHFNICHLKSAPHQYRHLSGLLEIFKSKLVRTTIKGNSSTKFDDIFFRDHKFLMTRSSWLQFDLLTF